MNNVQGDWRASKEAYECHCTVTCYDERVQTTFKAYPTFLVSANGEGNARRLGRNKAIREFSSKPGIRVVDAEVRYVNMLKGGAE